RRRKAGPSGCSRRCTSRVQSISTGRRHDLCGGQCKCALLLVASCIGSGRALCASLQRGRALCNHGCASGSFRLASGHLGNHAVNAAISPATAQIAADPLCNFLIRRMRMLFQKCFRRDRETWRTEAALLCVVVDEGCLYRMWLAVTQSFGGNDLFALSLDGESGARVHGSIVDQHRASAALTTITDALRAGDIELPAHSIEQRDAWFQIRAELFAIDF